MWFKPPAFLYASTWATMKPTLNNKNLLALIVSSRSKRYVYLPIYKSLNGISINIYFVYKFSGNLLLFISSNNGNNNNEEEWKKEENENYILFNIW